MQEKCDKLVIVAAKDGNWDDPLCWRFCLIDNVKSARILHGKEQASSAAWAADAV